MSSLLGRSDNNLRAVLGFAKRSPCCMLLDEIDAIAKRRSDDTDVGELKQNRQCDTRRLDTQGTPTAMYYYRAICCSQASLISPPDYLGKISRSRF